MNGPAPEPPPVDTPEARVVLVEDDAIMRDSLADRLELEGFAPRTFERGAEALDAIPRDPPGAILIDIRLPDMSGEALFSALEQRMGLLPPTLFLTGYGSVDQAVRLLKQGATDYLTKPVDVVQLLGQLRELIRGGEPGDEADSPALGISPPMRDVERLMARVAGRRATPVLITGESGVGKEEVARRLHRADGAGRPFVAVNCTAIADSISESEIFGHERGAFTGASSCHRGVFEQASGGTLFLDEIGDMPLALQAKFLRAIQERRITRVGGEAEVDVDVRLLVATNQDLGARVAGQAFREDLWYRINVLTIHVPPLRDRREDIQWLAERFLAHHRMRYPGEHRTLSAAARDALTAHDWPGNVRELHHVLERACILAQGPVIQPRDLFERARHAGEPESLSARLAAVEREHIRGALDQHNWRIGETAAALGITRKTLWQKMTRLGIGRS